MARPHPWTVMIKYKKTGKCFFVGGIRAKTETAALQRIKELGYCLTHGAFELKALRVPMILFPKEAVPTNGPSNQSINGAKTGTSIAIRTTADRK